ncbi:MAG: hypothetical protein ACKOEC_07915 [Acidimicrobiia bacterium]
MSKPRTACLAMAAAVLLAGRAPSAQPPTLDAVLKRSAAYVAAFRKQLAGIVAEETYVQTVVEFSRIPQGDTRNPMRTLKSDLLLIQPRGSERYVELRDVFEMDGSPVHTEQGRLEALLRDTSQGASAQIGDIIERSAKYNIGRITRNINTPLMPLQFLDAVNQPRFRFRHLQNAPPVFTDPADQAANDSGVFRASTEMWAVAYEERDRPTIIRQPGGRDQPAKGRFWINPHDGSILISELIVDGGGVLATITVSYQSEPLMGFLVPIEMRETYIRNPERITGHAKYGRFRQLR